jgi:hypothetical protein
LGGRLGSGWVVLGWLCFVWLGFENCDGFAWYSGAGSLAVLRLVAVARLVVLSGFDSCLGLVEGSGVWWNWIASGSSLGDFTHTKKLQKET